MKRRADSEIFDRSDTADFEMLHSPKSEVVLAAERRDSVKQAIFFDDPYSDETISASAHIRLCTTEW